MKFSVLQQTKNRKGTIEHKEILGQGETVRQKTEEAFSLQFSPLCDILFHRLCPFETGTTACIISKECGLWKTVWLRKNYSVKNYIWQM